MAMIAQEFWELTTINDMCYHISNEEYEKFCELFDAAPMYKRIPFRGLSGGIVHIVKCHVTEAAWSTPETRRLIEEHNTALKNEMKEIRRSLGSFDE